MTTKHTPGNARAKAFKDLLKQFTLCESIVFDCKDPSLQSGSFEQKCLLDMEPAHREQLDKIDSLLKARARINLRLKIAENMLEKLNRIND